MTTHAVTLQLPEHVYLRLQRIALATQQSFDAVVLRAIQVGAPPSWEDAPAEFQADLAALDRLDDDTLWHIARRRQFPVAFGEVALDFEVRADAGTPDSQAMRR